MKQRRTEPSERSNWSTCSRQGRRKRSRDNASCPVFEPLLPRKPLSILTSLFWRKTPRSRISFVHLLAVSSLAYSIFPASITTSVRALSLEGRAYLSQTQGLTRTQHIYTKKDTHSDLYRTRRYDQCSLPLKLSSTSSDNTSGSTERTRGQRPKRQAPNKRTQLRWIAQNVENILRAEAGQRLDPDSGKVGQAKHMAPHEIALVDALNFLATGAQTQDDVVRKGREMEDILFGHIFSVDIKERVAKAAAMTGLHRLALRCADDVMTTEHTWQDDESGKDVSIPVLPSNPCQDSICSCLRRFGRLQDLQKFVLRLCETSSKQYDRSVCVAAFNIYLAALCDVATGKDNSPKRYSKKRREEFLVDAGEWLLNGPKRWKIQPNSASYSIVLQAAAAVGNSTMFDLCWVDMHASKIHPDIVGYNARLRLIADMSASQEGDKPAIALWHKIRKDTFVHADRFTIDLIFLPLLREDKVDQLFDAVDDFVARNSQAVVSEAFSAFLLTLCKAGEVVWAHDELFNLYLLPSLQKVIFSDVGSTLRLAARPTAKHVNILLEGYRRLIDDGKRPHRTVKDSSHPEAGTDHKFKADDQVDAYERAWGLFAMMMDSSEISPTVYTFSTMTSLCRSSSELSLLLNNAVNNNIEIDSVFLRAAITNYGRLGDASSATWLYLSKAANTTARMDVRTWNVLVGVLTEGAESSSTDALDLYSSSAADTLGDGRSEEKSHDPTSLESLFVDQSCREALRQIARVVSDQRTVGDSPGIDYRALPKPNSQTLCLIAAGLQHTTTTLTKETSDTALSLFRSANRLGIPADGRLVNAILRCFGEDINTAITAWKDEIRPVCVRYENRQRDTPPSIKRVPGKNLIAAYHGLLYVAGRALRPEIALRLVYAMSKEGLEPNEVALNCYRSGKAFRERSELANTSDGEGNKRSRLFSRRLRLVDPYESLLYVECTKYDRNDRRRAGEARVRIIV